MIDLEKQELRNLLRNKRREYHQKIDQSLIDEQLIARWQELSQIIQPEPSMVIAGYHPVGSELNILGLMNYLHNQGYTLCMPVVTKNEKLDFVTWVPGELSSSPDITFLQPDIALVPLLGFDSNGNRLGQGKGYYDRSLQGIMAIGVGYECQQLDNIPICDKDYPMDYIVIPEKILMINKDLK